MKSAKKILALILAGVMALALLTGCGKAASLDRVMAEGFAEYLKSEFAQDGNNIISVSYQVPELSRDIAPLFDENWITKGSTGRHLNLNHMINGKTIEETLRDILSPYKSAKGINFFIADVTDVKTVFMNTPALNETSIGYSFNDVHSNFTSMRVAVVRKTVNGRTYALAVIIVE